MALQDIETNVVEPESGSPRRFTRLDRSLRDIGGMRVTHNGSSAQTIEIPPNTEYFTCFSEDGDTRLDIGRAATSSSSIFVHEDVPLVMYPLSPDQGLSCFGASGKHASFRFFGYSVPLE